MSENTVGIAAKLYEARATLRDMLGEKYSQRMEQFAGAIQAEMKRTGQSSIAVAISLAANEGERPMVQLHLLSAAVEMVEPSPSQP
jgi:hypothetical protein